MPIYEYECEACGQVHEVMQKMSDKPLSDCPGCSGKVHKRISQCSFHLKGTGWYVTDYANGAKASSPPKDTKADSSAAATTPAPDTSSKTSSKDTE